MLVLLVIVLIGDHRGGGGYQPFGFTIDTDMYTTIRTTNSDVKEIFVVVDNRFSNQYGGIT